MASKEELSEQLALTQKLAAQVERMAQAAERAKGAYESQINTVERLAAAFNQINTSGFTQGVETMNRAVKESSKTMQDMGKTSTAAFKAMGKKVEETSKTLGEKFPKSVGVAAAAWNGFHQGLRNVLALGKGFIGFTTSVVSGLTNIAVSIAAIPFKMFEGLIDLAAKSMSGMNELAQAIENIRKQFGALNGPTNKAIIDNSNALKGFKDTGLSAWRVFGTLAQRLDYMRELATEMGGAFGMLRKEFEDNGGAILAYQKGLGIANEDMRGVTRNAVAMGKSTASSLKDMTKYSYELGEAFGLDAKLISRDMSKALSDVKHFGGATVKQIGEASTYARKLGFELKDIVGTLDAFDTFDTAAENAAKLSQAFGVNIDAFELMKAQSPDEQLELLRKSFRAAGVDASNFDRASLKLAATTTGLSEDIVQSALSMKNQGLRLDEIKKKSGDAEKKTLTQSQAMAKLADAIERLVQQGGNQLGGFWDTFLHGVLGGIESSKEFRMLMLDIQRALMQVRMIGVQLGRVLVKIAPGFKDILGGLEDIFKPQHFNKYFTDISDAVKAFLDPKSPNKDSLPRLFESFHKATLNFFDATKPGGMRVIEGFKTLFKFLSKTVANAIPMIAKELANVMKFMADVLSGRKKLDASGAVGEAKGGLGFLESLLAPILASLKNAWKVIKPPLFDLLKQVGSLVVKFFKSSEFKAFMKPVIPALLGAVFGPALTQGLLGGVVSGLVKTVLKGGGKSVIEKAVTSLAGGGAERGALGAVSKVAGPAALVAAAAAVGEGVEKYTKEVTSTLDHSSAVIGAGATGLVNALTLGLLPDDLQKTIANTFATVSDMLFGAVKKIFGTGFGESIKKQLSNLFEVFGNIWSVIKNLFTGDQASIDSSMKELGLSLLRWLVGAVNMMFIQLPILLGKLVTQVLSLIGNVIISLVGALAAGVTGLIDKTFGTNLSSKVEGFADSLKKSLSKASDDAVNNMNDVSKAFSDASSEIQDKYLRTDKDKADEAARKAAAISQTSSSTVAAAAEEAAKGNVDAISKVAEGIQTVKDVQAQLNDKNFDLAGSLSSIKDKIAGADFNIISDSQVAAITKAVTNTQAVSDAIGMVKQTYEKLVSVIKGDAGSNTGIVGALKAVNDMVAQTNQLNDALGRSTNIVDVKAKLDKVANAVGLGGKVSYTVNPSKEVAITVNLHVTMDAGTVERVIIERKESIIRDRLNFATSNPTTSANSTVSDNFGSTPAQVGPAGTKT